MRLKIPRGYWEDFSDRCPCDHPSEMPDEISVANNVVTIDASPAQVACLLGDAQFYADTRNHDSVPSRVVAGARRVVGLITAAQ